MIITGVIDGPLSSGLPKIIELKASADIPEISIYGVGSANNGGAGGVVELPLTGSDTANDHLYIATEETGPQTYLGVNPNFIGAAASVNGDDAIELFKDGVVVDVFGDVGVDGSGTPWEYQDGWAYKGDVSIPSPSPLPTALPVISIGSIQGESHSS